MCGNKLLCEMEKILVSFDFFQCDVSYDTKTDFQFDFLLLKRGAKNIIQLTKKFPMTF